MGIPGGVKVDTGVTRTPVNSSVRADGSAKRLRERTMVRLLMKAATGTTATMTSVKALWSERTEKYRMRRTATTMGTLTT